MIFISKFTFSWVFIDLFKLNIIKKIHFLMKLFNHFCHDVIKKLKEVEKKLKKNRKNEICFHDIL